MRVSNIERSMVRIPTLDPTGSVTELFVADPSGSVAVAFAWTAVGRPVRLIVTVSVSAAESAAVGPPTPVPSSTITSTPYHDDPKFSAGAWPAAPNTYEQLRGLVSTGADA